MFASFVTHDIFEKERIEEINANITRIFGSPDVSEKKSGNTNRFGKTLWVSEKKIVWKINDLTPFLDQIPPNNKNTPDFDSIFKNRIKNVYVVGISCEELPYYQVVIYGEHQNSAIPVLIDIERLVVPFQIYLEKLNGFSSAVYDIAIRKPRFYSHVVMDSPIDLKNGISELDGLKKMQEKNSLFKIEPNIHSGNIRNLPILIQLGLPTVLSAINYEGGVLSFVSHVEQFGGGGELQTTGIIFTDRSSICIPDFTKQGIEKEIMMFCPNTNIFFNTFGGINLHLFLVGITTWISYIELKLNELLIDAEKERENIQKLLNARKLDNFGVHRDKLVAIQGSFASLSLLLTKTQLMVIEWINEVYDGFWLTGENEIPIPQTGKNPFFERTLVNRVGSTGYFEMITKRIKNQFDTTLKKLESMNSINKITDFIYDQTNYDLEKTMKGNSIIEIIIAVIVGIFTSVSILPYFGVKPP